MVDVWVGCWNGSMESSRWQYGDVCVVQFSPPVGEDDLRLFFWKQTTTESLDQAYEKYRPEPAINSDGVAFEAAKLRVPNPSAQLANAVEVHIEARKRERDRLNMPNNIGGIRGR